MKIKFVDQHTIPFHPSYDLSYEKLLIEKIVHKGFRPVKGDYFKGSEGHLIKIKNIIVVDEYNLLISIIIK